VKRIVILASGSGSNAQAVIEACQTRQIDAEVTAVVSNVEGAGVLERAGYHGIESIVLPSPPLRDFERRAMYDHELAETVAVLQPDVIVLAGWMLILGPEFMERFPGRVVNVHPALLPDDSGDSVATSCGHQPTLRGALAVRDALRARLPVTGATVHLVTNDVDSGPVLLREEVAIQAHDDEASLHARIKEVEHRLLPRAVATLIHDESVRMHKEESWETA
jgi:phosphoribosylglycinamide formyltransferase-1